MIVLFTRNAALLFTGAKDDSRSSSRNALNFSFYPVDLACKTESEMKPKNLTEMDGCGELFARLTDDKE